MANSFAEFYQKYAAPVVEGITVGFSGIDPSQIAENIQNSTLTPAQIDLIDKLIQEYMASLSIQIDSGNVDPDAADGSVIFTNLKPSDIPHEQLGGLLGGDEAGHYHLTESEAEKLKDYPKYSELNTELKHQELPDLQGGSEGEHYHLTLEQLQKLISLVQTFIPSGSDNVVVPEDDHEKLKNLLGGNEDDHYHLTGDELYKLQQLIELTFPNGATSPTLPSGGTPSSGGSEGGEGGGDDTPGSSEGEIDYGGLPNVAPPEWVRSECPKINSFSYSPVSVVHTMYYGKTCTSSKTTATNPGLHVLMGKGNATYYYLLYTEDLKTWTLKEDMVISSKVNKGISQFLYSDTKASSTSRHRLYTLMPGVNTKNPNIFYLYSNSSEGTLQATLTSKAADKATTPYIAGADCGNNLIIFVAQEGKVARVVDNKVKKGTSVAHCGISVNPGCAAWSPKAQRFCVSGPNGTAVSSDGATWSTYTNAPKNLTFLTYRADIDDGVFFALSTAEKVFYASKDGMTWARYNTAEIPVTNVAAVAYCPDLGWYCAIGGNTKYAYFSKNLTKWVPTKVTDVAVDMGSVIWMGGNVKKFVLMPKNGVSFYTFDPADWRE